MKKRKTLKHLLVSFSAVAAILLPVALPAPAHAQAAMDAQLGGEVSGPVLTVTNSTDAACQLLPTALGTVAITEVTQQDQAVQPTLIDTASGESLEITLAQQWQTVQPGDSVDLPLRTFTAEAGVGLESYTWSPEGGSYVLAYELEDAPYTATLNYSVPIAPEDGAPACPSAAITATIGGGPTWLLPVVIGVAVLVVALLVIIAIWLIKRKRPKASAAAVLAIGTAGALWFAAPVSAEYSVPESAQGQFDACMATFSEHGDITGEIVNFFSGPDAPNIRIIPNTDMESDATDYRPFDDSIHINWDYTTPRYNPNDRVPSDPCASLFHELTHAYNMHQGTNDRRLCGDSGIPIAEVLAMRQENRLRAAMGLEQRTHYGHNQIPEGECDDPDDDGDDPEIPPCEGGEESCAETNGDPHLRTFDGVRYDFQAVGEFVAVESTKDNQFIVQVRQTPWSTTRRASINQSVAMQVGDDRVEFGMSNNKPRLLINGDEADIEDRKLPGGGSFAKQRKYLEVTWPDGSKVYLRTIGSFGFHIVVKPAAKHKGSLQGILGNADGNKANDLHPRGSGDTIEPTFDQLYPSYADSWRVTSESSLFTYGAGESTETYTDRSFPDAEATVDNVPGAAAAEVLCRRLGVTQPDILRDCIIDVAITGRPEFAYTAQQGQATTAIVDYGGQVWHVNVAEPGDSPSVSFTAEAGEKVFIDAYNTTLLDQCGILTLRGPEGNLIGNGCILGGRGSIDGVVLPDAGTYTLTVDPSGDATGRATLVRIPIEDQSETIEVDGPPVTATIDRPGVVARLTFEGRTGQRVFVDASDTTLSDQCGVLVLRSSSRSLGNGCIGGGSGYIDAVELPEDGTYTVVVNPSGRRTGSIKINVIDAPQIIRNLTIGEPPAEATIERYGSRAVFSFHGEAGQRVAVNIQSTIPDQCGAVVLRDPDDQQVRSACIFRGVSDFNTDGITLTKTGTYKLTIDPTRRTTGTIEVTIRDL